jgi:hypothetical protein
MFIPDPGYTIFSIPDLGSRVTKISDPGSGSASKNLTIKAVSKPLGKIIWDVLLFIPDPDFFPSRIPDPGVKKSPDPDPQHWLVRYVPFS